MDIPEQLPDLNIQYVKLYLCFSTSNEILPIVLSNILIYHFLECGNDGPPYDIVFIFDDSGSQGDSDFANQISFFKAVADSFLVSRDHVNIAGVKVASTADEIFGLTSHLTNAEISNALDQVTKRGGGSAYEVGIGR